MREKKWLLIIILVVLLLRLSLAFLIPNFTYDSYFNLRQTQHITETGKPLYQDPLSYGGRETLFLPVLHYLTAFFDLFLPLEITAKVLSNLLIIGLILIVFIITKTITQDTPAALSATLVAGLLPVLFTTNSFSVQALFLPLVFAALFCFLNLHTRKYLLGYIFIFMLLSFTSSATILLLMGFLIYILLSILENKKIERAELEVIFFSWFFFIWAQFLFFKQIFLTNGLSFIWHNIPSQILTEYFPKVTIIESLVVVSVIPFLVGLFVVFRSLFQLKNKSTFLFISLVLSTTILSWLRLIPFDSSLEFISVILALFFGLFYQDLFQFIRKTKFRHRQRMIAFALLVLIILTMLPPALSVAFKQQTPTDEEINAFKWLGQNTPIKSGAAAILEEGHLITYYGKRRNIIDTRFDLIPDTEERFAATRSLFTSSFQTQALDTFDEYKIQYLVVTPHALQKYNTTIRYKTDECFPKVYGKETAIYRVACTLATEE